MLSYCMDRNVLTASFYENSLIKLVVDLLLLGLVSKHLDDLLDPLHMTLYLVISTVGSAVATSIFTIIGYVITRYEGLLFNVSIGTIGKASQCAWRGRRAEAVVANLTH